MTEYHAHGSEGLFAESALCGAKAEDEPEGILRMTSLDLEVTCAECRKAA